MMFQYYKIYAPNMIKFCTFLAGFREGEYQNVSNNLCFQHRTPNQKTASSFYVLCLHFFIAFLAFFCLYSHLFLLMSRHQELDAPNWLTYFFLLLHCHLFTGIRQVLKIPQGSLLTNNSKRTPLIGSVLCVCKCCSAQQLAPSRFIDLCVFREQR